MIVFHCQGGLGNQLFQFATAYRLSKESGVSLVVDRSWFQRPLPGETIRDFELENYLLPYRQATAAEEARWNIYQSRIGRALWPLHPLRLITDTRFKTRDQLLKAGRNCYLRGFWQSCDYFADIQRELTQLLSPKIPLTPSYAEYMADIESSNAISIHIRRGDYVTSPTASAYHGICSIAYYREAVRLMISNIENPKFFVFSDDIQWCRQNLPFLSNTTFVSCNDANASVQELHLMTRCRAHIIANSSYSWWGAWLAGEKSQLTVAPKNWFQAADTSSKLIPQHWVRI